MSENERTFKTGQGRVWMQDNGGSPAESLNYMGRARMGGFTIPFGDISPVKDPSASAYDRFEVVDYTDGEAGLPTTSMVARFGFVNPLLLNPACRKQIQVHYGLCQDPTDLHRGWDKILHFEQAKITQVEGSDLTALEEAERAPVSLTAAITAMRVLEVDPIHFTARGGEEITRPVVAVVLRDYVSCGECGYISDGNQRVFAVIEGSGTSSPGMSPELLYSLNQGRTITDHDITTLTGDEQPTGLVVAGQFILVPSTAAGSVSYTLVTDLDTWAEVLTGFAAGGAPVTGFALSATQVWMVGQGGYIYFSENPTSSYEVQHAGTLTTENLARIHGVNSRELLAGGANGALLVTHNGGRVWALAPTSPTLADITAVWMRSPHCWLVGDAGGNLYYTVDGGTSWYAIGIPGAGTGEVTDIQFSGRPDSPFGFLSQTIDGVGRILRTIDCGATWYELPEGAGEIPTNGGISCLAAGPSPNIVIGGGTAADGTDGQLIVGA